MRITSSAGASSSGASSSTGASSTTTLDSSDASSAGASSAGVKTKKFTAEPFQSISVGTGVALFSVHLSIWGFCPTPVLKIVLKLASNCSNQYIWWREKDVDTQWVLAIWICTVKTSHTITNVTNWALATLISCLSAHNEFWKTTTTSRSWSIKAFGSVRPFYVKYSVHNNLWLLSAISFPRRQRWQDNYNLCWQRGRQTRAGKLRPDNVLFIERRRRGNPRRRWRSEWDTRGGSQVKVGDYT